ncbi:DUF475 domain-containing protein [Methanothrix sp.]|uniref:DUF475 domain-containing protein n=1 Tax=Methanothrix sp. TaxID=90426 RepID=UPI0034E1A45C
MDLLSIVLTIGGLCLFEVVSSIDNAIINAEVLSTMQERAKRWFLSYGIILSVFLVRGLLPWALVWITIPTLGAIGSITATFSDDPEVIRAIQLSSPVLLIAGGVFLLFLFFHWLFIEPKQYGLKAEYYIHKKGVWFFAIVSILLTAIVWFSLGINKFLAFGAVTGSTAFFIVHGFRQNAELQEKQLSTQGLSDISKILYLEVLDATFSIDGVVGAFAFTLSVPLILVGNGLGAAMVRQLTIGNIERIKRYVYLKNGAMYSIFSLGLVMILESFGHHIPSWMPPVLTFVIVGFFFYKSVRVSRYLDLIRSH